MSGVLCRSAGVSCEVLTPFHLFAADLAGARASEDKLRTQLAEASHRERVFARRLAHKDHEMHDLMVCSIG